MQSINIKENRISGYKILHNWHTNKTFIARKMGVHYVIKHVPYSLNHDVLMGKIRSLQQITHQNLNNIVDYFPLEEEIILGTATLSKGLFIVHKYQDTELFHNYFEKHIDNGVLNRNVSVIFLQSLIKLCEVLKHIHKHNHAHGNIKAENVCFNKQNQEIFLLDFGLTHLKDDKTLDFKQDFYQMALMVLKLFSSSLDIKKARLFKFENLLQDILSKMIARDYQNTDEIIDDLKNLSKKLNQTLSSAKKPKSSKELENLKTGYVTNKDENLLFLDYLFNYAKQEIIIASPWINTSVIKRREKQIKNALNRGVHITIHYGMKNQIKGKEDMQEGAKTILENIQKQYSTLQIYKNEISDHSKIIICDKKWMVMGSYNWLSFLGKDKRGETGMFSKKGDQILKMIDELNMKKHQ
ncbi:phospholipase D-like domain-containing protein [Helicobacter cetorum]|uniref:phospholipase D-like domain-containing protein n=1 Tax=Helicobacter cetorum TaxID=138563 RepID=UPI000CF0F17C|nr:phospholipase D-like domain-containing protein [Helicobacter cetorum]